MVVSDQSNYSVARYQLVEAYEADRYGNLSICRVGQEYSVPKSTKADQVFGCVALACCIVLKDT